MAAADHSRPSSPAPAPKRLKLSHVPAENHLATNLLADSNAQKLHLEYISSSPYKYAIIDKLFRDELLRNVKDECLNQLVFTEKETDIYKVNQTGDLASLSYLQDDQIALLPNLLTLRDTLYSPAFRSFIRRVTGCPALSGTKQDMSVNTYRQGCHLLNHDDVIGSRRVSYILYMPLPHDQVWQKEWGGALELYPTMVNAEGVSEPTAIPVKSIPPSWNQFIFFEVQPGKSFHSVEEVVVGVDAYDGRERLSISGWFHAAQAGEEGYEPPSAEGEAKSSREQLTSTSTVLESYADSDVLEPQDSLTKDQIKFLRNFLSPAYLDPKTMAQLSQKFAEESSLELHTFLNPKLAKALQKSLPELDARDGLGPERKGLVPPHESGTKNGWSIQGPPHKWRYCTLSGKPGPDSSDQILQKLQDELFPSQAFRAWLSCVSRLLPLRYAVEARRFRPGLDYTLATSEEKEARLDVVLGLTPNVVNPTKDEVTGWQEGDWGGWECYMAPNEDNDDPAVYRTGPANNAMPSGSKPNEPNNSKKEPKEEETNEENDMDEDEEDDDDDEDGTLLTVQPSFNNLLLVLRDEGVMRFVKYVSAAAEGSRWDVCGEYEVGKLEVEDEDD